MNIGELAGSILDKASGKQRFLVAIAGAPASGKSTLSEKLRDEINRQIGSNICAVVPMDGYHLDNVILEGRNLLARKGSPETFDARGFLHLIKRIRAEREDIIYPTFDRELDKAIAGSGILSADQSIVLVEGNYLLCNVPVWHDLRPEFDHTIFLDVPIETLEERLVQRWLDHGYDEAGAAKRARSNDIPNAGFVVEHCETADLIIR